MSTLREEIAALPRMQAELIGHPFADYVPLLDVLARVDKHEAVACHPENAILPGCAECGRTYCEWFIASDVWEASHAQGQICVECFGKCVRDFLMRPNPPEQRPAREALREGYEHMDFTQTIMAQHGLAIVEAIDALTAAIREGKQ